MSSVSIAGNTSGSVTLSAPDVAGSTTLTLPTTSGTVALTASPTFTGTVTTPSLTFSDGSTQTAAASPFGLKNRIINGDMVIDQRNNGASVVVSGTYTLDRWVAFESSDGAATVQQVSDAPTGFSFSMRWTTTTADGSLSATQYAGVDQRIEGFNVADLGWGTANAQTITLSFWVKSSLTGTFGGALANSAFNRSYPFTYSIPIANTWTKISITIAGDTSGTWLTNNGVGMYVQFGLGVGSTFSGTAGAWSASAFISATGAVSVIGTLNATWQITGVQLERNTTATPFEWIPYGTELALCQRYYYKILPNADFGLLASGGYSFAANSIFLNAVFPVTMRVGPSSLETTGTAGNYRISNPGNNITLNAVPSLDVGTPQGCTLNATTASGVLANLPAMLRTNGTSGYLAWSAEL